MPLQEGGYIIRDNMKDTPAYRNLVLTLADLLPSHFTFNEIANYFYRGLIIDKPESPYRTYDGSKSNYVKEKLSAAQYPWSFLSSILPEIFFIIDIEYGELETKRLVSICGKMGFHVQDVQDEEKSVFYRELIPPNDILRAQGSISEIHISDRYPATVRRLLQQLNANLLNDHFDASALLIRRVIFISSITYLKSKNLESRILDQHNDYKELSKILDVIATEIPDVSKQLIARLRNAKILGDYANHSLHWRVTEVELEQVKSTVGMFLDALFAS